MTEQINLGDLCEDKVSGYKGIVVAVTQWMTGCRRLLLQASKDKEGKIPDTMQFDEPMLKIIKRGVVKPSLGLDGGPGPKPTQAKVLRR